VCRDVTRLPSSPPRQWRRSPPQRLYICRRAAGRGRRLRAHHGVHPRIGATDVCPFVPLEGSSLEECRKLAAQVGRRVGNELDLPVYLYGDGAPDLAELRRGQYEGLADRLASGQLPQFGPPELRPRFGALAIGAREVLVAYNIDLDSKDARLAGRIAARIRGSGYLHNGVRIPGRFATLRAIGWYIEEYGNAQVSMNVGDYRVDSLLSIFTAVESLAHEMGCSVLSSELIGLAPRAALPDESGQSLRLRDFDPELRILERCVERSLRG
jgi:glutamate formiminotransferase